MPHGVPRDSDVYVYVCMYAYLYTTHIYIHIFIYIIRVQVAAVKGLWPVSLPPLLMIHLKRFTYVGTKRVKVDSAQSVPVELDLAHILDEARS